MGTLTELQGRVDGVLGKCLCEQNADDFVRPCPIHYPPESEQELASELLAAARRFNAAELYRDASLFAKAAAVIDRHARIEAAALSPNKED